MELEEERRISKSMDEEKASETSNEILPSDEIRADSDDELDPEVLPKLAATTESCFTDPSDSVFESSLEAVGFPQTAAKPIIDENTLVETKEFSSNSSQSPLSDSAAVESSPVVTKGNGLRKWRRIKRDLKKEGSVSADSAQILKRRSRNTDSSKSDEENKLKSKAEEIEGEDSVASLESRNTDINPLELEQWASGGFSIGMDSDNSEDHSSKSSTATSAPWQRHEGLASGKERGKLKSFGGKGSTRLGLQKGQLGRGGTIDASKKTKGELNRFEKENSLSSVESDLRSSVLGVVQLGSVVDSNGNHNGRSLNFDEHSDEGHTGGEEVRSGYYKENGITENLSKEDLDAELLEGNNQKSEDFQSISDLDPFAESVVFLQEAQEALEKEIQNIEAIGKEQKLQELEALLGKTQLPEMEGTITRVSPVRTHEEELDSELEVLLMEKLEAEIEHMILSRTTQNWKNLSEDHIALFKEKKYMAGDQEQMMLKLRDAEEKIIKLNEQKDKLEVYCKELVGTENVLRLQSKACKFSVCVTVQLLLLGTAFWLFLMRLLSPVDGVVPT